MILITSFWITKNECCNDDEEIIAAFPLGSCNGNCLCCGECDWKYLGECCPNCPACSILSLMLRIILLAPLCIFAFAFSCGKHVSRMFAAIGIIITDTVLIIMSSFSGTDDTYCVLISFFSFVSLFCNLFAIILPNCKDCECLSYYEIEQEYLDENYDGESNPEEGAYPEQEDIAQEQFNKPGTPDNNGQNQGNVIDDRNSINAFDAPTPLSVKNNNEENN